MAKRMKVYKQIDIFTGAIDRKRKEKPKPRPKLKLVKLSKQAKLEAKLNRQYFEENQATFSDIDIKKTKKRKRLPLLPDEYLKKGFPDIVTRHKAFKPGDASTLESFDVNKGVEVLRAVWDDKAILASHNDLLVESLEVLRTEGNNTDKADVLSWVFAGDVIRWHNRLEKAIHVPFSFFACCVLSGYDPYVLQEGIYVALPDSVKSLIHFEAAA